MSLICFVFNSNFFVSLKIKQIQNSFLQSKRTDWKHRQIGLLNTRILIVRSVVYYSSLKFLLLLIICFIGSSHLALLIYLHCTEWSLNFRIFCKSIFCPSSSSSSFEIYDAMIFSCNLTNWFAFESFIVLEIYTNKIWSNLLCVHKKKNVLLFVCCVCEYQIRVVFQTIYISTEGSFTTLFLLLKVL